MAENPTGNMPTPICKAILLCEQAIIATDGKVSLIDVVVVKRSQMFPCQSDEMKCYLQLVAGFGAYQLSLEILDLAEDRLIAKGKGPVANFADRLTPLQFVLPIPSLPILHPGRYDVIVLGNDNEIDRQQFIAATLGVA